MTTVYAKVNDVGEVSVIWSQYVFWILGILGFGWFAFLSLVRPEVMNGSWRRSMRAVGLAPERVERYLGSRWRRLELLVSGVGALGVSALLLWALVLYVIRARL
jgi:hypothetical protein